MERKAQVGFEEELRRTTAWLGAVNRDTIRKVVYD